MSGAIGATAGARLSLMKLAQRYLRGLSSNKRFYGGVPIIKFGFFLGVGLFAQANGRGDFGSPISLGNCGGDFGSPIQASADVLGARSPRGVPEADNPPFEATPTRHISRFPVPPTSHL